MHVHAHHTRRHRCLNWSWLPAVWELLAATKQPLPADLAVLLLGTILVDTRNFDPKEAGRYNDRDRLVVAELLQLRDPVVRGSPSTPTLTPQTHPHASAGG